MFTSKKSSLSDKIRRWMDYKERMLDVKDVKEFIKELKERFADTKTPGKRVSILPKDYRELIDKLAGDKLI